MNKTAKARRVYRLPDGGKCKRIVTSYPTKITYLDVLEEDCWDLFKKYEEVAGVSFYDDETNFFIAKEIQEKIITLIEENLNVGFPVIGTNEYGTFCKVTEQVTIDTEWEFGIKTSVENPDDITTAIILEEIDKGELTGCINGVKWAVGFSVSDKNALASKEFCEMAVKLVKKNKFCGKYKGTHKIDYYIINGKKYSAVEIIKADSDVTNPLRIALGFKAALADITT